MAGAVSSVRAAGAAIAYRAGRFRTSHSRAVRRGRLVGGSAALSTNGVFGRTSWPRLLLTLLAIFFASVSMAAIYSGPVVAAASLARVVLFGISVYTFLYVRDGPGGLESAAIVCAPFAGCSGQPPLGFVRLRGFLLSISSSGWICTTVHMARERRLSAGAGSVLRSQHAGESVRVFPGDDRGSAVPPTRRAADFAPGDVRRWSCARRRHWCCPTRARRLLNLAVALMVLLWLHRDRIRWRRLLAGTAIFFAGAAALLSFAFPVFAGLYWQRVSVAFEYFWEAPNQVMSGRLESWRMLGNFIAARTLAPAARDRIQDASLLRLSSAAKRLAITPTSACWWKPASRDWLRWWR